MEIFYSTIKEAYVTTNFKVMYSTLYYQESLTGVHKGEFFQRIRKERLPLFPKKKKYLLVRNPYTRLESFFRDKFRNVLRNMPNDFKWQNSQKIFFELLDLSPDQSTEVIREKFLNLTFEDFISMLPVVYKKDQHLCPQNNNQTAKYEYKNKSILYKIPYDRVLKMESKEDLIFLETTLCLDFKKIMNSTKHIKEELVWTKKMKTIVQSVYEDDFRSFNYVF